MTSHFYWIGAIPAMVFVGIFMMPFYYGSRARSVPEYLKLRFDEKTRGFNAITFAGDDGVLVRHLDVRDGQAARTCCWAGTFTSASGVSAIDRAGLHLPGRADLRDLQRGAAVLPDRARLPAAGVPRAQGRRRLGRAESPSSTTVATNAGFAPGAWTSSWRAHGTPAANPMGVEWFGMVMGLGFVLSFGYWCTDFLVVQRAMAADSMTAARRTPLIAAVPKMLFPVPGDPAGHDRDRAAPTRPAAGFTLPKMADGTLRLQHGDADDARALLPAGHAGPRAHRPDGLVHVRHGGQRHGVQHGLDLRHLPELHQAGRSPTRTTCGWAAWPRSSASCLSVAAAYAATQFNNIMDMLQLVFAFVNAPLFATFLLGMFWKRATGHGAFFGLLLGTWRGGAAPRADAAAAARRPAASRAAGSRPRRCTPIPARWRRTSGPRSAPGRLLRGDDRDFAAHHQEQDRTTSSRAWSTRSRRGRRKRHCHGTSARPPSASSCWARRRAQHHLLVGRRNHGPRHPHSDRPDVLASSACCSPATASLTRGSDVYQRSLGYNINLGWGVVLLVFGAVMLFFGRRGRKKQA